MTVYRIRFLQCRSTESTAANGPATATTAMAETTTAPTADDGYAEATATAATPTAATGLPTTTSSTAFWTKSKTAATEHGWLSSAAATARLWRQRRWQPVHES